MEFRLVGTTFKRTAILQDMPKTTRLDDAAHYLRFAVNDLHESPGLLIAIPEDFDSDSQIIWKATIHGPRSGNVPQILKRLLASTNQRTGLGWSIRMHRQKRSEAAEDRQQ